MCSDDTGDYHCGNYSHIGDARNDINTKFDKKNSTSCHDACEGNMVGPVGVLQTDSPFSDQNISVSGGR